MTKILLSVILTISSLSLFSQNFGLGASAIYNFQTESFGVGVRGNIFPNKRLSIVPQASYYFGFNKVEEYIIGVGLEYKLFRVNQFNFYALGHGAYNNWLNYENSAKEGAAANNWNAEAGIGISTNSCLRPFLEYRYNFKFLETHLQLGLLYIFGCKKGSSSGKTGMVDDCPQF